MGKSRKNRSRITLSEPGEIFAALPHILGFRPVASLVLIADAVAGRSIGKTARCDLPHPGVIEPCAEQMVQCMISEPMSSVLVLVVGEGHDGEGHPPPHADLVDALRRRFDAVEVVVSAAYWVPEIAGRARWRCYDRVALTGLLPDPKSTVLAAEAVGDGKVTFDSREEVERIFTGDDEALLTARSAAIDAAFSAGDWSVKRGAEAVRSGLRVARTGIMAMSDDLLTELALALRDVRVRDACLATALPVDAELAETAERLWQSLTRSLPAPERAEAACLAGFAAYVRGDGVVAGIALDLALEADPHHVLAGLLDRALARGMAPGRLHGLAEHDEIGLCAQARAAAA